MMDRVVRAVTDAGVDPSSLDGGEAQTAPGGGAGDFVPLERFVQLVESAAERLADRCLGLRLGLETHPKELGALGFVLLNSPTFGEAVANAQRYLQIHQTHAEIEAQLEGRTWSLSYWVPDPKLAGLYQDGEYTVGTIVNGIRILSAGAFAQSEVHLRRGRPPNAAEYEALLSSPVSFGRPRDAIFVDEEVMAGKVVGADADLLPVLAAHANHLTEQLPGDDALLAELRRLVAESLRSGPPRLGATARRLGMSERTLQRRLDERGLAFGEIAEGVREGLARQYVAQRELSLTEVAFLLGYSELSTFGRAFRRWTGHSPRDFRKAATNP